MPINSKTNKILAATRSAHEKFMVNPPKRNRTHHPRFFDNKNRFWRDAVQTAPLTAYPNLVNPAELADAEEILYRLANLEAIKNGDLEYKYWTDQQRALKKAWATNPTR